MIINFLINLFFELCHQNDEEPLYTGFVEVIYK
jgi:hypothetical protein